MEENKEQISVEEEAQHRTEELKTFVDSLGLDEPQTNSFNQHMGAFVESMRELMEHNLEKAVAEIIHEHPEMREQPEEASTSPMKKIEETDSLKKEFSSVEQEKEETSTG